MLTINVGSAQNAADDLISLYVPPGATVTVKTLSGSTMNHHSNGHSGGVSGTIAVSGTQTFTGSNSFYISSQGRSTVQITGPGY